MSVMTIVAVPLLKEYLLIKFGTKHEHSGQLAQYMQFENSLYVKPSQPSLNSSYFQVPLSKSFLVS